ncbi:MAG: hypothetical protein COA96_08720 [SAR86 cluster bacterium]|uniref:DUF1329 domain-containing protein n=1 Tax=SAR86 cluster bacterium TaxID=2030880 RepID=A0A2A5AZN8_9GAMM|nr:MAG: hypothetical protein COA96_08720 [SAR86 cluster bacterium]
MAIFQRKLTGYFSSSFMLCLLLSSVVQAAENPHLPRTADDRPDFNGIWQAIGSANWNIEPHAADFGPLVELGAIGAIPAGLGVVVGGKIPYTADGRAQQLANKTQWLDLDPLVKCYMPGIPRANYLPFPFQIIQSPQHVVMAYEFASASRIVYMSRPDFEAPIFSWMGHSRGHFEGDTLVIDVTDQVPDTWLDHAGNHHTDALRVTERYTHIGPNTLMYEAILEDSNVYTEPWSVKFPLYRRLEQNMQLLEFKCVEFTEELIYGHLRKGAEVD